MTFLPLFSSPLGRLSVPHLSLVFLVLLIAPFPLPGVVGQSSSSSGGMQQYGVTTGLCGYREFRFDWLATYDLVYSYVDTVDYGGPYSISYYFRVCGNVTAADCASIEGTATSPMLCQSTVGGSAVSLGYYSHENAYWSIPGEGVVQMYLHDGALLGGTPRTTIVEFFCDPLVMGYPANFTVLVREETGVYYVYVATSFACGAVPDNYASAYTPPSAAAYCNYAGYNLTSLASRDLAAYVTDNSWGGPYYEHYYYRPCGVISNAECAVPLANLVPAVCQYTVGGNAVDMAVYRPDLETWSMLPNGAGIQSSVTDGSTCSNGVERTVIVQWLCNATATNVQNFTINEAPACTYTLQIQTALVCNSSNITPSTPSSTGAPAFTSTTSATRPSSTGALLPGSSPSSSSSAASSDTNSTQSSASSSASSGLSSTNKIVVGVVVGVGVPLLLAALVLCCMRRGWGGIHTKKELSHSRVEDDNTADASSRQPDDVEMSTHTQ